MSRSKRYLIGVSVVCSMWYTSVGVADTVTLPAIRDTAIFDVAGETSSGQGDLFVGQTGGGTKQRGLVAFDVSTLIPTGSTVTRVDVTLRLIRGSGSGGDEGMSLHQLLQEWGEGNSVSMGGGGAPATTDDATWSFRFFGDDALSWNNAGADFVENASATTPVGTESALVTWSSTSDLVADVQTWLDNPETDFGWIIVGNESDLNTARRFASRETSVFEDRPMLSVEFDPPSGGSGGSGGASICGTGLGMVIFPIFCPLLAWRCRRRIRGL